MRRHLPKFSAIGTLCATLLCGVGITAFANAEPPQLKRTGVHIIIDNGSGEVRTYYRSEEQRTQDRRPWRERILEENPPAQPIIAAPLTTAPAPRPADNAEPPQLKRAGIHVIIDDGSGNVRAYHRSEEQRAQDRLRPWRKRILEEDSLAQPVTAAPKQTTCPRVSPR
jgi:hypothetical protein